MGHKNIKKVIKAYHYANDQSTELDQVVIEDMHILHDIEEEQIFANIFNAIIKQTNRNYEIITAIGFIKNLIDYLREEEKQPEESQSINLLQFNIYLNTGR